jgi:hypothetical protein
VCDLHPAGPRGGPATLTRRRVLAALLLAPAALVGVTSCSLPGSDTPEGPDPLVALAARARADAALAAAVIAAEPALADRVEPLRAARAEHAGALDAEVARLEPAAASAATAPGGEAAPGGEGGSAPAAVPLALLRDAVLASARDAAEVALGLPAERVGLVASVAACCAAYAEVLA